MTFIKRHLIDKIKENIRQKQLDFNHKQFFFFNRPIQFGSKLIDRITIDSPYYQEEILPSSYYHLTGHILKEIYFKLKRNEVYFYTKADNGRFYKQK